MRKTSLLFLALAGISGCTSDGTMRPTPAPTTTTSTPAPSPTPAPTPAPAPAPTVVSLSGTVRAQDGSSLANATVVVVDGQNSGWSALTDAAGNYQINGLNVGNANVSANASGYLEARAGTFIDGTNRLNFTLRTIQPWSRSGSGNTVFDMPRYLTRVRIQGTWNQTGTSNFIVHIGGQGVVNEILRQTITYDGVHLTSGGVVEIVSSTNISWTFTEVR